MSSIYICPQCGLETESSTAMACHCVLSHHAPEAGFQSEALVDMIISLIDDLSKGIDEKDRTEESPKELVVCSGKCESCFTSLCAQLEESGFLESNRREPRKLLYSHYPAVALQGLYCLRSRNGCWYLRSENPKWLHNPFKSKDGYWYEADHSVRVNNQNSFPENQVSKK